MKVVQMKDPDKYVTKTGFIGGIALMCIISCAVFAVLWHFDIIQHRDSTTVIRWVAKIGDCTPTECYVQFSNGSFATVRRPIMVGAPIETPDDGEPWTEDKK